MKIARKIAAAPFLAIGFLFMGIGSLIAGQYLDLLDEPRRTH